MRTAACDLTAEDAAMEAMGEDHTTLLGGREEVATRGGRISPRRRKLVGLLFGLLVFVFLHTLLARSPVEIPFWHSSARPSAARLISARHSTASRPTETAVQGALDRSLAEEEMVIQTFNLCFAIAGDAETLRAVLESDADVLILQESTERWRALIEEAMRTTHPHQFWRAPSAPYAASGGAILSRFPLSERRVVPSAVGWFESLLAVVDTPHGAIQVVGVHLQPAARLTDLLTLGQAHQREMAHAYPATALPVIVAGDFNEERGGAVAWLEDQGLVEGQSHAPTWRWPIGSLMARLRIDHVFVSPELSILRTDVLARGHSDHLPVRTVVRFDSLRRAESVNRFVRRYRLNRFRFAESPAKADPCAPIAEVGSSPPPRSSSWSVAMRAPPYKPWRRRRGSPRGYRVTTSARRCRS